VNIYYVCFSELIIFASSISQHMKNEGTAKIISVTIRWWQGILYVWKEKLFLYSIWQHQLQVPSSKSTAGNISVWYRLYRKINNRYTTWSKVQFTKCFGGLFCFSISLIVLCALASYFAQGFVLIWITKCSAPLTSVPVWAREFDSPEERLSEFCRECRVVRKGM
jgi:hypothetical protein